MKKVDGTEIMKFLNRKEGVSLEGDFSASALGFCSLNNPKSDCVTWIKHPNEHSLDAFYNCSNNIVVTPSKVDSPIENTRYIITDKPKVVFFDILDHFWAINAEPGISENSVVETSNIGNNVSIGHNCYIGPDVVIGNNTVIQHNVSIVCPTVIGDNCLIHSGTVIGTDGFGFYIEDQIPTKVKHFGGVVIGNDVEIGANSCIDRATIDNTIIHDHVKIDNLCHIAHNVEIEDNVMIIALSLIAGSAKLQKDSYIGPNAVVKNQLTVGENAFVGMGAVVTKDVEPDMVVAGVPAKVIRKVRAGDK